MVTTAAGRADARLAERERRAASTPCCVDGRRVGEVRQINTPGQWLDAGVVDLRPAGIAVEVTRARAPRSAPATPSAGELGPVALQSAAEPELVSVAPARRPPPLRQELGLDRAGPGLMAAVVTVAIPVLNGGPLLRQVLAAVREQEVEPRAGAGGGRLGLHRRLARGGRGGGRAR